MTTHPEPAGLHELTRHVQGEVLTPSDAGYARWRTGFQLLHEHRPDVIVVAEIPADVQAAVRFAVAHGLDLTARGTGHGTPDGPTTGVLVITAGLDEVTIDHERATVRIGAGVRWARVLREAAVHGLTALPGTTPEVNAVAYTLGGGVSVLGRTFGYAADYVNSLQVVTADGELREVDEDTDPDLFWALCGGGGAYAIVTAMEIELVRLEAVYGGGLVIDAEHVPTMLRAWRDWTTTVPDTVTSAFTVVPFPDVEALPPFLRGRHVAVVWVAVVGSEEDGIRLVQPLRDAAPALADTVQLRTTDALGEITNDPTDPAAFTSSATTFDVVTDDALEVLLSQAGPGAPETAIVELRHLGGALSRPQRSPNAVGQRQAGYSLGLLQVLRGGASAADARARQRAILEALAPWTTDGAVLNLMGDAAATAEGMRRAFDSATHRRLGQVKAVYDPGNLFSRGTPFTVRGQ
ncbi:MAG: FAD-binding oxidoreductase [Propionibacteriales bacterium]|nr:FAD-binding oxidoreductase [Propionibacteriales bacterium]